jgi:hypothetical protein
MNVVWERWFPVSSTFLGNYLFWQQHRESAKTRKIAYLRSQETERLASVTLSFVIVVIAASGSR